jgi:aconitate decarboxylase
LIIAALAIAEQRGKLSGAGLINAVIVGIETAARVAACVGTVPHEGLGFHNAGLMGTFASVAAAARALELGPDDIVHALGHAGQQAASLMFTHHGGMGKRLLAGQAARGGTFGALLAANGFTNAPNVFEAEYGGFCAAHTGNRTPPAYDLAQLTKDLGTTYHSAHVRFKMWATRNPNHASLEAIKALRLEHTFAADDVKQVRIRLGKGYLQNVGWRYTPTTITSAQLNLYYVVAIMLLENDVFVEQFSEEKIRHPKVLELIERISLSRDPALDGAANEAGTPVEIELNDGSVLSTWGHSRGGADNPLTCEDVLDKFRKVTRRHLTTAAQDEVIQQCDTLDTADDAASLISALFWGKT